MATDNASPHSTETSSVVGRRRPRRSSIEVRSRILSAAVMLFAERGYGGTATREIAELADVAEAVIFRIYATKRGLFEAAVIQPFDEFLSEYTARWLAAPTPGGAPEEVLEQFVRGLHDVVGRNRQLVTALSSAGGIVAGAQPALAKLQEMGSVVAATHGLPFDPALSVRIATVMVVAVTLVEDQLFDGAGDRLVSEMIRMLVGAARYDPEESTGSRPRHTRNPAGPVPAPGGRHRERRVR